MENDESKASEHARVLSELGAAKGGHARANKLTPEQRREIARDAAAARWAKSGIAPLPIATHAGPLKIGEIGFDCAVLEDGTRLVSEQKFMAAMGMYRSGALSVRRRANQDGAPIPLFLAHKNLRPYAEKHLGGVHFAPFKYRTLEGGTAHGIRAELIPKICEIWIDAERAGVLGPRQKIVAANADLLLRGLAHVGIVALVDEATGYQDARAKDALAKILEAFIAKELRKWVNTFPVDYYKQLFRLRGWKFPDLPADQKKRPILVGKITNDVVYDRLAPGVRTELHKLTPRDDKGRLKYRLHRWLTEDVGHPKLREHLASLITLMKASDTWEQFKRMLDKALPRYGDTPYLPFED